MTCGAAMSQIEESIYESNISILSRDCIAQIAKGLNPKKVLPSESGLLRDWRGLAEICGRRGLEIDQFDQSTYPALNLLQALTHDLSVSKLLFYLEELDRYDVIEDCQANIEKCLEARQRLVEDQRRYPKGEYQPVTTMDVAAFSAGQTLPAYDSFILYADTSPVDSDYALRIRERLESESLLVCSRVDLEPGLRSEIDALAGLIKNRCRTVILIASNELFHTNSVNTWLMNVIIALTFEQTKKIIPCRIDHEVRIPESLAPITKLDFCNPNVDSYSRLVNSVRLRSIEANSRRASVSSSHSLASSRVKVSGRTSGWIKDILRAGNKSSFTTESHLLSVTEVDKENKKVFGLVEQKRRGSSDSVVKKTSQRTVQEIPVQTKVSKVNGSSESAEMSQAVENAAKSMKKSGLNKVFQKLKKKKKVAGAEPLAGSAI